MRDGAMLTSGVSILNREQALTIAGLLICPTLISCSHVAAKTTPGATDAVPVHAVLAVSQDVPLDISAIGSVEAIDRVEVKARIAGQIGQVAFEEGQNVTKGQLLFTIDRNTLDRQAAQQQAELERDVAMEQQARAVVARDTAAQKQSQSEADVAKRLGELGVLSGQRVDQLVTTSDTARAGLRSDQAAVDAAIGATKADRARLAQTWLQLGFADVAAPISGRAGAAAVKAGNMVRENDTTLVTLMQLTPIDVAFGIPEQALSEVRKLNASAPLTVEAISGNGPVLHGKLAFIDNTIDASTGTIRLKAVFPNLDGALWPGQFVDVRLRLRVEKGRVIVPQSSIQNGLDGKYIWIVRSGIATTQPVIMQRMYRLESGAEQAVIGGGVRPGEMIVSEGQLRLVPGSRVRVLDAQDRQ
jgi:membrane fusion protein, multidrug efflux system